MSPTPGSRQIFIPVWDAPPAWDAGLTVKEHAALERQARADQVRLMRALMGRPEWVDWHAEARRIAAQVAACYGPEGQLLFVAPWADGQRGQAAILYRTVLKALLNVGFPRVVGGHPLTMRPPDEVMRRAASLRESFGDLIALALRTIGEPLDFYREGLAAGLLIEPALRDYWVVKPIAFSPSRTHARTWERTAEVPTGFPVRAAEQAARARRALEEAYGVPLVSRPRPPRRAPSNPRRAFLQYVVNRQALGVTNQFLVTDAEARALYGKWKRDGDLTERALRLAFQRAAALGISPEHRPPRPRRND